VFIWPGRAPGVACTAGMKSPLHSKRNTDGNKANHAITCYPIQPCRTHLQHCGTSLQERNTYYTKYTILTPPVNHNLSHKLRLCLNASRRGVDRALVKPPAT
jgi:hypothetical protein